MGTAHVLGDKTAIGETVADVPVYEGRSARGVWRARPAIFLPCPQSGCPCEIQPRVRWYSSIEREKYYTYFTCFFFCGALMIFDNYITKLVG